MIIRKAKLSDFEEWFKLEKEFTAHDNKLSSSRLGCKLVKPELKKFFKKIIYRKSVFLVLEDNGKLYGHFEGLIEKSKGNGYVSRVKKTGYINNAYITKKQRGKGYFSEFVKQF